MGLEVGTGWVGLGVVVSIGGGELWWGWKGWGGGDGDGLGMEGVEMGVGVGGYEAMGWEEGVWGSGWGRG